MKGLVYKRSKYNKRNGQVISWSGERSTSLVIPASINKDGTIGKNTSGVNVDEFDGTKKICKTNYKRIKWRYVSGNISISPYKSKEKTSCDFCQYSSICQFDSTWKIIIIK